MNTTIYKYPLNLTDEQVLKLPQGYRILSVQVQTGQVTLWAIVNPTNKPVETKIRIHGTGHSVKEHEKLWHIDTIQLDGGVLVFHVFEEIPNPNKEKQDAQTKGGK